MKLVSAGKLRKAKATFEKTNENFHYITHSIAEIFNNSRDVPQHYLLGNREIKTTCYIIVTSCKGLCGGFNSSILKEAQSMIDMSGSESVILAIGMKAKEYFEKRGYEYLQSLPGSTGEYFVPGSQRNGAAFTGSVYEG